MEKWEASYTVELALLLPIFLFALFAPIYAGYDLYGQARENVVCGWDESFCASQTVRKIILAKDVWEVLE